MGQPGCEILEAWGGKKTPSREREEGKEMKVMLVPQQFAGKSFENVFSPASL